jgi:hypothetical protein
MTWKVINWLGSDTATCYTCLTSPSVSVVSGTIIFPFSSKGDSGPEFPTGGRREGGPGRAEKNFYLYISREGKEPLKHVSEPLGAQVHCWELKQRAVVS